VPVNKNSGNDALAALAAIAQRSGVETSVDALRRSYVISEGELPAPILVAIARDLGLHGRRLTLRWRDLPRLQKVLPAMLRLNDGSVLLLEAVLIDTPSGQIALLRDPTASPEAQIAVDEVHLSRIWGGETILLRRRHAVTDEHRPFGLAWLTGQVLREGKLFRDIAIASLISTIFALAPPFIVMIVVDRVLVNHSVSTLIVLAGLLGFMIVFEMALSFLRRLFMEVTATRIDGRLNLYIMEKLLKLPMEFFERTPTGMIAAKLGQIWRIRNFLTGQLFGTFLDMVMLIVLVPVLVILQWQLALLVFAMGGIIFVIIYVFLKPLGRLQARLIRAEQQKDSYLVETIYGMRTIKSLALEGRRRHEWDWRVAEAVAAKHAFGTTANYPQTLALPFERLIYSGSIVTGAFFALSHPDMIQPGALMAFGMLAMRTGQPLVQLARLLSDIGDVHSAITEVSSVMNIPPENARSGYGLRLPISGEISFQNVQFRYSSGAPLALDGVSIEIRPGSIFGIMGRSGSGKTTITRLLQGLNPNYEGVIKIDGMDLREIDLHHLRTSIGVVPQENFLFRGTVRENIGMARADASFAQILRAAQLAGAEEFIERMPRGYDTFLEEGATNLSGGQRQRLAIARALILDPPVMILDEATSALDAESEAIISANLLRIAKGRTTIMVSHRLSMLVPADAILVMERGKVYDIGTHDELLHRCDIYRHMWYTQNRHLDRNPVVHPPLILAHSAKS
jgi:ATP-binding cassette, subfamily B, bacterial HlyB/CyaB